MIKTIRVEMLGGLSVWVDGTPLLDSAAKINKPWQVFCYLVLNRGAPASAARLLSVLWPEEDLSDPANVLKNTVYALRREFRHFEEAGRSPVLFESGGYTCNPDISFELDAELFEQRAKEAVANGGGAQRTAQLGEAVSLYKGDLLPQLESEIWVMPKALYYKQQFHDCAGVLCEELYRRGSLNELLAAATSANRVDPLDESYYLYIFRALYGLKMYRAIIPAYNKTVRIFTEELGAPPGQEIREIAAAAGEHLNSIEQDVMIIKEDLREVAQDSSPVSGPLYCTYDVFKYLYQMVARSSERAGVSVVIVLLTLQELEPGIPPAKVLSATMNQIKALILGGLLRKSDVVARYSKSQYIIMLSVEKAGGADMVMNRIRRRCEGFLAPAGLCMVFATTELDPIG